MSAAAFASTARVKLKGHNGALSHLLSLSIRTVYTVNIEKERNKKQPKECWPHARSVFSRA